MKAFILLACCLLTGVTHAQYQAIFGRDTTIFELSTEILDAAVPSQMTIYGDTTIATMSYRRVRYTAAGRDFPGGFVREDTISGRTWYREPNASTELLVQDLNLAVGDTFYHTAANLSCSALGYATVRSVDTDTADRKVITLDCIFGGGFIYDTLQFIEGVGPNASLFWACITRDYQGDPSPCWNIGYAVCAQYQDGELRYEQNDCPLGTSTTEPKVAPALIFPNPTTGGLYFRSERPIQTAQLYRFDGQLLHSYPRPDQALSLASFPTGVYWLRLYYQDGSYSLHKVIRQ
jgi:hypothetical protein